MKEFIDKLIERLKAGVDKECVSNVPKIRLCDAIEIASELAEEYKVSEMPTGWIPCSIKKPDYEIYEVKKLWVTMHRKEVKHCFTRQLTWNGWQGRWEWDNGKPLSDKWEVIAWKLIDIPAPYTEGE